MPPLLDTLFSDGIAAATALIINPRANISGIVQQAGSRIVSGYAPSASGVYETGILASQIKSLGEMLNADAREIRDRRAQAASMGAAASVAGFDAWSTKVLPPAIMALSDLATRAPALALDPNALNSYRAAAVGLVDRAHSQANLLLLGFASFLKVEADKKSALVRPVTAAGQAAARGLIDRYGPAITGLAQAQERAVAKVKEIASSPTGALLLAGAAGIVGFYLLAPALGQFAGGYVGARRASR